MRLDTLQVQNCRNIEALTLQADPALTVIAGPNGQGKTNLLECIWLLTGSKSFRGAKDIDLVREGALFGKIWGNTRDAEKENAIELTIGTPESGKRGRSAKVNGVPYGRATSIAGVFTAVVFEPGHLGLVKAGPDGRRRFLDAALCQLYPNYIGTLRRFSRAVTQKNAILKKYAMTPGAEEMLDAFDVEIAATGDEIMQRRAAYVKALSPHTERFYAEISSGAESLRVQYLPCCEIGTLPAHLRAARPVDIRAGHSTFGPQREDLSTSIDERDARTFGSQGQQRSVVLSLKLAEAQIAREITGQHPVMLLDDVLSELDPTRQAYLLGRMQDKQCFVTTCDAAAFERTAGKVVQIKNGNLFET